MNLHEHMERAVADTTADLTRLTGDSRRQGLRLRRQRHVLSGVGVAAALAAIVSGASLLTSGPGDELAPAGTESAAPAPASVPFTGRAIVAALRAGIDEVAAGTYSDFGGQEGIDAYGRLEFAPADGLGAGEVGLRVSQPDRISNWEFACGPRMIDCTVRTLPNGDQVRSYQAPPDPAPEADGITLVAELVPADRSMHVGVTATNGFDGQGGVWDVTRPDPVLNLAQLRHIVAQPAWGLEMPHQFQEAGDDLADYVDFDTDPGWTLGSD